MSWRALSDGADKSMVSAPLLQGEAQDCQEIMLGYSDSGKDAGRLAGALLLADVLSTPQAFPLVHAFVFFVGCDVEEPAQKTPTLLVPHRSCMGAVQVPGGACPGARQSLGCLLRNDPSSAVSDTAVAQEADGCQSCSALNQPR